MAQNDKTQQRMKIVKPFKTLAWHAVLAGTAVAFIHTTSAAVLTVQTATADAVAKSSSEKKNYGNEPVLELRSSTFSGVAEAYLRFDFPPAAAFSGKASLRFFAQLGGPGNAQVVVRTITDTNWSEDVLAWRWRPEHSTTLGSVQVVGVSGSWYEMDVSEFVRSEVAAGRRSANFVLVPGDGAKTPVLIQSREAESRRPELVFARQLFSAKVCFLPKNNATAPAGFMTDSGARFGVRAPGSSYGWNIDNSTNIRDRSESKYAKDKKNPSVKGPDHRYDCMAYMDGEKMKERAFWEIAVPNGTYKVHVVAGDAQKYDSIYGLTAEKAVVVQGVPEFAKRWVEGTAVVDVKDGRLTINNTPSSSNNKLCFVEIEEQEKLISSQP
jgi:hypothetical protein